MADYSIGVDLGGTKILVGIVDTTNGQVVCSLKKKTKKEKGSSKIIKKISSLLHDLLSTSDISLERIKSIGIGVAGQIDREQGILISAPNLDCDNLNLKSVFENEFHLPVCLGNDVEVATIGELLFGTCREHENFVCVFVGTGVGSGIVLDNKFYSGFSGTAGEIGHIIVANGGRQCGCGANGCLEAYASRTAIEQKIKGAIKKGYKSIITEHIKDDGVIRSKYLKMAFDKNDELVRTTLSEAAEYLSSGLASVINFLNPEMIILGGGLIDAINPFFTLVKEKTLIKCLPTPSKTTIIEKSILGDYAGIIGAAMLKKYRERDVKNDKLS